MKKLPRFLIPVLSGTAAFVTAFSLRHSIPDASPQPSTIPASSPSVGKTGDSQAWKLALAERDPSKRLEGLAEILSKESPAGLSALASQQLNDPDALAMILRQWAQTQPSAAAQWVMDKKRDGQLTLAALDPVMEMWAENDSAGLTAWFKEPGNRSAQYSQLPKLIGAVFARDPAAALALAADFPIHWKLPDEATVWIKADPAAATKACLALPTRNYNSIAAASKAMAVWAETDASAAVAWAAAQTRENPAAGPAVLEKGLQIWAGRDPAAEAAWFRTLPPGEARADDIVKAWTAKDPESALQWAGEANAHDRAGLIESAVSAVAESDIGKASALVSRMEDGPQHDMAMAGLTRTWAAKDPKAALTWASELPAGPARDKSLSSAISKWAGNDVTAAAAWVREAPESSLPPEAYSGIMWHLGRNIPAASEWLNALPEGPASRAMDNMFIFSREPDVNAALALPAGKYRERIVEAASTRFFQTGPDQALAWALSLPDAGQRQQMRHLVEGMEPTNEPSTWNQITREKKTELLQRLK